jgi:hypothetical protein
MVQIRKACMAALLCGVMALGVLTGCGGSEGTKETKDTKPAAPAVKVEAPVKAKVGNVDITTQKWADYSVKDDSVFAIKGLAQYQGKLVYGGGGKNLTALALKDNVLSIDKGMFKDGILTSEERIENPTTDAAGYIYFRHGNKLNSFKDGKTVVMNDNCVDSFAPVPDGKSGYLYLGPAFKKAILDAGVVKSTEPGFVDPKAGQGPFKQVDYAVVDKDSTVYLQGYPPEGNYGLMISYSPAGQQLAQFGGQDFKAPDKIGGAAGIALTDKYVCVAVTDGLKVWAKDGTFIGAVKNKDLFGDDYRIYGIANWDGKGIVAYVNYEKATKKYDFNFVYISF